MSEQRLLDLWLPPAGAGEPLACLATSFTFDTDFFRDDCLGRFLGMRASIGESAVGELAQINELEERLAQVTVTAIVDRSATVDSRNLRWDLLPVSQPKGLLHSKTALVVWESAARVIIGSANLTPAGYRYQRELAIALDLAPDTVVPRPFWDSYLDEWLRLIDLIPDDVTDPGPKARALAARQLAAGLLDEIGPPSTLSNARIALAPSRPGESALEHVKSALVGNKPRMVTALSPFWDADDQGEYDAVRAITSLLASTGNAAAEFMVPLVTSTTGGLVHAPRDLPDRMPRSGIGASLWGVDAGGSTLSSGEGERRRLHAKALVLQSDTWVTVMMGSSNMTTAGLGLSPAHGHVELNIILGAPLPSDYANRLLEMLPDSLELDPGSTEHAPQEPDEDEPLTACLPAAFLSATLLHSSVGWQLLLALSVTDLPSDWAVSTPSGRQILSSTAKLEDAVVTVHLPSDEDLPQGLLVSWADSKGEWHKADWVINVSDPSTLPVDERLRAIPVDLIVQALASRSLDPAQAIERLLDHLSNPESGSHEDYSPLDPLRRFDDSRALLRRMQTYGRALDQLTIHLSRPAPTASSLSWRLTGLISPSRLAEGWAEQYERDELPLDMAHFLFSELHLAVSRIDWSAVTAGLSPAATEDARALMRDRIETAAAKLPALPAGHALAAYVKQARSFDGS
ncbi:MAG: hypothetical protein U0R65_11355 [Candidatus Nanopelagicales bacterium]